MYVRELFVLIFVLDTTFIYKFFLLPRHKAIAISICQHMLRTYSIQMCNTNERKTSEKKQKKNKKRKRNHKA